MRLPVLCACAALLGATACTPATLPAGGAPSAAAPVPPLVLSHPSELRSAAQGLVQAWAQAGLPARRQEEPAPGPGAHLVLAIGAGEPVSWDVAVPTRPFLTPDGPDAPTPRPLRDLNWDAAPVAPPQPAGLRAAGTAHPQAAAALAAARAQYRARPQRPVTLAVVGDFMLARGVGNRIGVHGPGYPVELVAGRLRAADLTVANLESPIGVQGRPLPGKGIWFRAEPRAAETLTLAGIDLVTLANNHILDYDTENFLETMGYLEAAGVRHAGGGRTLAEAREPAVLEAGGLRFAFLSYSVFADLFFDYAHPRSFAATDVLPGVAPARDEYIQADVARARQAADVVAVAFHWGEEYQNHPNAEQMRLARLTAAAGADLVLGFHPHAVQGFAVHGRAFTAYSFGNFIMDDESLGTIPRESFLAEFTFYPGGGRSARITPAYLTGFRPAILTDAAAERLRAKLVRLSAEAVP